MQTVSLWCSRYRLPWYSRGIRQKLWNLTRELEWDKKYNVRVDGYGEGSEKYSWCVWQCCTPESAVQTNRILPIKKFKTAQAPHDCC